MAVNGHRRSYYMKKELDFVNSIISQMTIKEKIGQITMLISGMNIYGPQW